MSACWSLLLLGVTALPLRAPVHQVRTKRYWPAMYCISGTTGLPIPMAWCLDNFGRMKFYKEVV